MSSLTANQRGIIAILGCMLAYTFNDALVKLIVWKYPLGQIIFVRGMISALLIGAVAIVAGHGVQLRTSLNAKLAWRSVFDGLSTACFIAALAHMALADIAAVLQITPLLLTALSVLFHGEAVGWRRWTAIGVGFAGALLIVKPAPSTFEIWSLIAAGSALFAALRELQNRRIDRKVPTLVIAFYGAVGITLFGGLFALREDWRMVESGDLLQLSVAAAFVATAIYLMALGFRGVDFSVVAPFRYSYLLTSAAAGYIVFNELPDGWSAVGAALIVGSGLYALHREAVRRRQIAAETAA